MIFCDRRLSRVRWSIIPDFRRIIFLRPPSKSRRLAVARAASTTARNCGNGSPAAARLLEMSPNEIHKRNFVWLSAARAANMYYECATKQSSPRANVRSFAREWRITQSGTSSRAAVGDAMAEGRALSAPHNRKLFQFARFSVVTRGLE